VTARDHGEPPRTSHVDVIVVVDQSIPYEHRRLPTDDADDRGRLLDANLPLVLAALGLCAAFVIILIVLIACAATACAASRRRASRTRRQVPHRHATYYPRTLPQEDPGDPGIPSPQINV